MNSISSQKLNKFSAYLSEIVGSPATVEKYVYAVKVFGRFMDGRGSAVPTREALADYKEFRARTYKKSSANSMMIPLNKFLAWHGQGHLRIKAFRLQRRTNLDHIMSREEYEKLLETAERLGMERCRLLMRLLASTGMRIDEVRFVTVESLANGVCHVSNKGKSRDVFIPEPFCEVLKSYCGRRGIESGVVFHGRNGDAMLDKARIWREMNAVAQAAGFAHGIVHAHSFRHFFAKEYMEIFHDLPDLADILGHSSLETTRIYTRTTSQEKRIRLEKLGL